MMVAKEPESVVEPVRETNKQGQRLGTKGHATKRQILDATFALLHERPFNEVVVPAITSRAATSHATFYRYFSHLDDAFLELSVQAGKDISSLDGFLQALWPRDRLDDHALAFVEAHMAIVRRHRPVIHVRNFSADRGDDAFERVRMRSSQSIIVGLARQIHRPASDLGTEAVDIARCKAAVLFTGMERLAIQLATPRSMGLEDTDVLLSAQAEILVDVIRAGVRSDHAR